MTEPYYADESVTLYHGERRLFVGVEMVEHYQRIAERRIREAQGQAVTRGSQPALDFGEGA